MPETVMSTFAELVNNGDLEIGDGYRAKLEELVVEGDGPLFLRAGALSDRGFNWNGLEVFGSAARIDGKRGRPGDVVITTKGNSIGRVGRVPVGAPEFVYSPHLSYWRSLRETAISAGYMYYWAQGVEFLSQLRQFGFGTDMAPYLSLRDQLQLTISIPPVSEQRAIAEVLGSLDDKIAANDRDVSTIQDLADAKFQHAVREAPIGGATFATVAQIGGGGTPKTSVEGYWGGAIAWATPTDVTALSAPYLLDTSRTITNAGLAACASSLYPTGSILMTSRATIGAFAIAQGPVAVNQGFIVVNANDPDAQWWLFHEMRARVPEFLSFANGATFLELPRGRFKEIPVRLAEPEAIRRFSEEVGTMHRYAAHLSIESQRLASTRDELLPLLISEKLFVKDVEKIAEGIL